MHRYGLGAAMLLGVASAACGSAGASAPTATVKPTPTPVRAAGPYTVDLDAQVRGSCQTGAYSGSWPVIGHVTMARGADGTITTEVTMNHGRPNQPYQVELVQMPNTIPYSPVSCGGPTTVFTTDASGHGTGFISAPAALGTTGANVHVLGTDPELGTIATSMVTFG